MLVGFEHIEKDEVKEFLLNLIFCERLIGALKMDSRMFAELSLGRKIGAIREE
jgi:hypothetical protein